MKIKGFDRNLCCRNLQYEIGKEYKTDAEHITQGDLCSGKVLHYCDSIQDVDKYYPCRNSENRYCEIEVLGEEVTDGKKYGSNHIRILREITGEELQHLKGLERENTGLFNTGNGNSGDCNTGNRNAGDYNTGDRNTGNRNAGHRNTSSNNTGDYNAGGYNAGNCNTGSCNAGDYNTGNCNAGGCNAGDRNTGNCNAGGCNAGDCNAGNYNIGYCNTGNWNIGNSNTGDCNSGDCNSGDCCNGYRNSGVFCNKQEEDTIPFFNQDSNMTWEDWCSHPVHDIISRLKPAEWVNFDRMSKEEKAKNKNAIISDGYLKTYQYKEAWANLWKTLTDWERESFKTLPNFNAGIFEEITGIKIL